MPIKINYLKTNNTKSISQNIVLFSKEKFKINDLKSHISKSEFAKSVVAFETKLPEKTIVKAALDVEAPLSTIVL